MRGNEPVREHLTEVGPEAVGISIITLAELRYGAACSAHPEDNQRAIDGFISAVATLGLTPETARTFGDVKAMLRRRGALIEDLDLLIASTAHARDLTLVTNNARHFLRIPELRLESWTQDS